MADDEPSHRPDPWRSQEIPLTPVAVLFAGPGGQVMCWRCWHVVSRGAEFRSRPDAFGVIVVDTGPAKV